MRLTWAPRGRTSDASSSASEGRSLTPSMRAHSNDSRRPFIERYSWQAAITAAKGHRLLMGTSLSRSSSLAACSDTARLTGRASLARRRIPGTRPTVETVKWRRREAEFVVEPFDRRPHRDVVGQRLAHPHEHHVADPAGPGLADGGDHLLDDLARAEVAGEPRLAGGAEAAVHGAARLGGDAHRGAVRVVHEDGLDRRPVVEAPRPFHRLGAVGHRSGGQGEGGVQRRLDGQALAQGEGEVGHLRDRQRPAVKPVPDLAHPVGGLVGHEVAQLLAGEVVGAGHGYQTTGPRLPGRWWVHRRRPAPASGRRRRHRPGRCGRCRSPGRCRA